MLKKILVTVVVLIALVLAYATTRPDTFAVQRSATIKAPPDKIYALNVRFIEGSSFSHGDHSPQRWKSLISA